MVKRISLIVVFLCLLTLASGVTALAGHVYYFSMPSMTVDAHPQPDGMMRIVYTIVFENLSSDPLDIVDIGVPHKDYDLSTFKAWINGYPLSTIRPSQYVKPGVEIPLSNHTIAKGKKSAFKVEFTMPQMIYYDDDDKSYVSVEFGNTYFGSDFTTGTTKLTMRYHFPPGVTANETKWHRDEPTDMRNVGDHIVFTWVNENASPSKMYKFGIGFPTRYVEASMIQEHSVLGDIAESAAACAGACFAVIGGLIPILFPIMFFLVPVIWRIIAHRRRMKHYLPPALGIEGAGPKRGLTAPEAAVVLELAPTRVLMMILFGMIKKGAVKIISRDPLKLERAEPAPKGLRPYEVQFLAAIKKDQTLSERDLRRMFIAMVKATNNKLKGFSRKETRQYYRTVMKVAWEKVETASTPQVGDAFAQRAEWLMIDDDFADRTGRTFANRDVVIMPRWWGYWHGPGYYGSSPASVGGGGGGISIPGANMANDFTTALGNFSNTIVDSVSSFTNEITQATNPPPVRTSSSGSYSGGGCACACACAGCACACAGGGR